MKSIKRTITIVGQRHGERDGDSLTQIGRSHIIELAESSSLKDFHFVSYYSSPKIRAQQTAQIIAGDSNVEINYGLYPPLTDPQIDAVWGSADKSSNTISEWYSNLPRNWGDKMTHLMKNCIEEIVTENVEKYPNDKNLDIYLCAHSLTFEFLLPRELQDIPPISCGDFIVFTYTVENGSVTLIKAATVRP